jgi:putative ABC transport system permease protein
MDSIRQDVRFAFRTLRRDLAFAGVAVLILGLGVGAVTAIFGVVNAVLLKPLPYAEPSRLAVVTSVFRPGSENAVVDTVALSDIRAWREQSKTLEAISGFFFTRLPVRVEDTAHYPDTLMVDNEILSTLGAQPAIGTNFEPGQALDQTVIISHEFWQQAFGGNPDVVGKVLDLSGSTRTVRGVLPADFELPRRDARLYRDPIDLFVPVIQDFAPGSRNFWSIARLAPNVGIDAAEAELRALDASQDEWSVRVAPLGEERTRAARRPLAIFVAIGAVLLLIMCTNLVNLLLARNVRRGQEMAIRRAVGATAGRIWRQQLTESLCLALLGGAVGITIAAVGMRFIEALSPLRLPVTQGVTLDYRVLGFGVTISVVAMLVVGFVPAFFGNPSGLAARARAFPRTQKALTIAQVGISIGLLAAAGVLAHSLWRLNTIDRGFETERVLGFQVTVPGLQTEWRPFVDRALEAIAAIPGVGSVGYVTFLPPERWSAHFRPFRFDGPPPEGADPRFTSANTIMTSADYFETVGMSLIRGRTFDATDDADSPPVMIVNEAFAALLRQQDPIGRRVFSGFDTTMRGAEVAREIVGVVNDTRDRGMNLPPLPTIYLPYTQGMLPYGAFALRSEVAPGALIGAVRERIHAIRPDVPAVDFQTLDERVQESLREPRFYVFLAAICAAMAVLFAGVGLYGVVAYSVSARTTELGVRMALGSSRARILGLVLRQGAVMAAVGAALGLVLAFASMRGLESLLFEVSPLDPPTLAAAVVFVIAVALVAAFVPAWRACRLSPVIALRYKE